MWWVFFKKQTSTPERHIIIINNNKSKQTTLRCYITGRRFISLSKQLKQHFLNTWSNSSWYSNKSFHWLIEIPRHDNIMKKRMTSRRERKRVFFFGISSSPAGHWASNCVHGFKTSTVRYARSAPTDGKHGWTTSLSEKTPNSIQRSGPSTTAAVSKQSTELLLW